jgi:hypothetical protein
MYQEKYGNPAPEGDGIQIVQSPVLKTKLRSQTSKAQPKLHSSFAQDVKKIVCFLG